MADLEPGLLRQPRNLLMISTALLLYELADGKLIGMSLMAGVKFEKDWMILLFGWVAFFKSMVAIQASVETSGAQDTR